MKINDRQHIHHTQTNKTEQAQAKAKTTTAAPCAPPSQLNRQFATAFDAAPHAQLAASDVLPPKMSPPTDERLAQTINDAYKAVFNGTKFPTGAERTAMMDQARKMRAEGKSAGEIQGVFTDQLASSGQKQNLSDADLDAQINKAFQSVYGRDAKPEEKTMFRGKAREMANANVGAQDIGFKLTDALAMGKSGTATTGEAGISNAFDKAYQNVFGRDAKPGEKSGALMDKARQWAKEGVSTQDIAFRLTDELAMSKSGTNATGESALGSAIDKAYQSVYGRAANAGEKSGAMMDKARQWAKEGVSTQDIAFRLTDALAVARQGGPGTTDDTGLKSAIDKAFQKVYGRDANAGEKSGVLLDKAREWAKAGVSAQDIGFRLTDAVALARQGGPRHHRRGRTQEPDRGRLQGGVRRGPRPLRP